MYIVTSNSLVKQENLEKKNVLFIPNWYISKIIKS